MIIIDGLHATNNTRATKADACIILTAALYIIQALHAYWCMLVLLMLNDFQISVALQ